MADVEMFYRRAAGLVRQSLIRCWALLFCLFAVFAVGGVPSVYSNAPLSLTASERQWLKEHPVIRLAPAANLRPYEFFDEKGVYRGVAADYVALLEKRLGIRFEPVMTVGEKEQMALVRAQEVDVVAAFGGNSPTMVFMQPLPPHIVMPGVLVSKKENVDPTELTGKRIAVVRGTQWKTLITKKYSGAILVEVTDVRAGLESVSSGEVFGLISDIASASYYIHGEGLTDVVISHQFDDVLEMGFAIRRDWPELQGIIKKAIGTISDAEKRKISLQWLHLKKTPLLQRDTFRYTAIGIVAVILVALSTIITWSRTLKKQVFQRTRDLNEELKLRRKAEAQIQEAHNKLIASHRELRRTQVELIHAEKMKAIGLLAMGIAHEVKNPLAVIRLCHDYIEKSTQKEGTFTSVLSDMKDAVSRAEIVVNRLLDFSREKDIEKKLVEINPLIEDSLHLVRHELQLRKIRVAKDLDSNFPRIGLDVNKMKQVFINVFMNGIQAMKSDGILSISSSGQTVGQELKTLFAEQNFREGQAILLIEVADTGPGLSEDALGKVFDPFYTTKQAGEGTGLGLFVVKNILDLHRGGIALQNQGQGGLSVKIALRISHENGANHEKKDIGCGR